MEDKKSFGDYICKRRKEVGLTQKEFADKLFLTESAISKWERGLSYPDITLVSDICRILSVSEHELLTASEDIKARTTEKLAQKYVRMINRYKYILSFIYSISLVTCFICNIAIQHKLSWFFIVLLSVMTASSITLLPVLIKRRKGLYTLGTFTVSFSLLLMVCCIYTGGNWFVISFACVIFGITLIFLPFILNRIYLPEFFENKKTLIYFLSETLLLFVLLFVCELYTSGRWFLQIALPVTLFSLILPWGMMIIIRYVKLNKYYKAAGCIALTSIFEFCLQGFISFILKDGLYRFGFEFNFTNWSDEYLNGNISMIIFTVLIMLSIAFTILGRYHVIKKRTE
jgi:transcriptional regulator with XRE-family HTH domain